MLVPFEIDTVVVRAFIDQQVIVDQEPMLLLNGFRRMKFLYSQSNVQRASECPRAGATITFQWIPSEYRK